MKPTLFNSRGSSVLASLVLMALVGLSVVVITQLQTNGETDRARAQAAAIITNNQRSLAMILSSPTQCQNLLRNERLTSQQPLTLTAEQVYARVSNLQETWETLRPKSARPVKFKGVTFNAVGTPPIRTTGQLEFEDAAGRSVYRSLSLSLSTDSSSAIDSCSSMPAFVDFALKCGVEPSCLDDSSVKVSMFPETTALPPANEQTCDKGFELNNLNDQTFEIRTPDGQPTTKPIELRIEFASYMAPNNYQIQYAGPGESTYRKHLFLQCSIKTSNYGFSRIERPPEDSIRSRVVTLPAGVSKMRFSFPGPSPFYLKINTGCDFTNPPRMAGAASLIRPY